MCKVVHRCLLFARNIEAAPLLFKVVCLVGLSWQLVQISSEYFKYKVDSRTSVFTPKIVQDLSMIICLPMEFSINFEKFNTELQYDWTPNEFIRQEMLWNLSIYQIYNYTYEAENILYGVQYRKNASEVDFAEANFSSILEMEKYLYMSDLCYLYSVRSFTPFSVQLIKYAWIMLLDFGNKISKADGFQLFFAEKGRTPFRETIEAPPIYRGGSSIKYDTFYSSHYSIRGHLLPPPYETHCYNYSQRNFRNSIECYESCFVLKTFNKWGGISIASLIPNKKVDYKFLKISNFTKYYAEEDKIRQYCQSSCPDTTCDDTQIVTIQEREAYYNVSKNISMVWQRKTPSIPSAEILCRPTSTLTELILYMMSSVSTWTGLSMMSINPLLLFRRLTKRKSVPGISTLELRRHRITIAINQTDQMSRLEDCVVSQSLAIEKLKELVFHLLNDRSRRVR